MTRMTKKTRASRALLKHLLPRSEAQASRVCFQARLCSSCRGKCVLSSSNSSSNSGHLISGSRRAKKDCRPDGFLKSICACFKKSVCQVKSCVLLDSSCWTERLSLRDIHNGSQPEPTEKRSGKGEVGTSKTSKLNLYT